MFKVIIVDDEPLIVRSVKNQIEILDKEFQVVESANDGMTALELIENVKPDLIFVDISMPVMDGFQLLENLRAKNNHVPAVILSGYEEFSYARKAIHLGVLDYLVKPLNPVTLGEFLESLKIKLNENRALQKKEILEEYLRGYRKDISILYTGKEHFYMAKICFGSYHFFRNNQFSVQEILGVDEKLRNIVEQNLGNRIEWNLLQEKEENEFLLLFQTKEGYGKKKFLYIFEELMEVLKSEEYVTFVTSEKMISLEGIVEEKMSLESYLYHHNVFAKSSYLLCGEEYDEETNKIKEIDYKVFRKYADHRKKKELRELVHELVEELNLECVTQAVLSEILKQILSVCCADVPEYEQYFMLNLVLCSRNYQELEEKFMEVLLEYSEIEQENFNEYTGTEQIVNRIKKYLDDHYLERIKIQEVADIFGFNYSYMCHLFRKHTEISPNEYIIMRRMDYAKELLVNQKELSIRELAEMCGYTDPYYFSRMFKAYAGMAPSEYKKGNEKVS